jgi:N-acetylgalactosamine-6-sulfatase
MRIFIFSLLLSFMFVLTAHTLHAAESSSRPNILFIYADDWGWGDLGCHGRANLKTPNLDRLAKEGTDFQQFVVCNPVCSPSRTAIVTGQYPARHLVHQHFASHEDNVARGMPDWLDPKVTLLPRIMKEAGYTTAHFGKWHLGGGDGAPLPAEYGYDDAAVWTGPGKSVFEGTSVADKHAGAQQVASFETIAATEHALGFIRAAHEQKKPFYLNFWLHETHHLVAATDEDKKEYPDMAEPQRTFNSAITRADKQVGRVLALLEELKSLDNTIVIFSSDNGPENSMPKPDQKFYFSVGDTGGLRGRKRSLYMGGVNVPFLVRWPGHVPAGRVDKTSVIAGVDMLPTLLAAAGVPMPQGYQSDGINVMDAFEGKPFTRPQPLFWEWRGPNAHDADWGQLAMRDGFFALVMSFDGQRTELYDLAKDRAQENDLSTAQTERVTSMTDALRAWQATLPAPPKTTSAATPNKSRKPAPKPKTKGEGTAKPSPDRAAAFKRWDTNHDNILTLEEYTNGLAKKDNAPQRFKNFDKNGDGKLTAEEFTSP